MKREHSQLAEQNRNELSELNQKIEQLEDEKREAESKFNKTIGEKDAELHRLGEQAGRLRLSMEQLNSEYE